MFIFHIYIKIMTKSKNGKTARRARTVPEYIYGPGPFASSSPAPSEVLHVDRRRSINDVPYAVLNTVAEYSDMPERIRLRQVNSTLRDGVPPTVPPWHCAFTDDAILDDCDAFWSKIAEIMAWFLIITHRSNLRVQKPVYFRCNRNGNMDIAARIADNRTLHQGFWWKGRVYTPAEEGLPYGPPEEQWMVENHEAYYRGCVMQMIQRWRKRLGEGLSAENSANLKGSAIDIKLSVYVGETGIGYMDHMELIKYIGGVIAQKLGHMYGLQVYYYRDMSDAGISIAGREPKYFHSVTPVAAGPVVYPLFAPF